MVSDVIDSYTNIKIGSGANASQEFNNGGIAIGNFTKANGQNSIAIGSSNGDVPITTTANGKHSIAIGAGIHSQTINQMGEIKIGNERFNSSYYSGDGGWIVNLDERDMISQQPIANNLKFINSLEPIRFRYNYRRSYEDDNNLLNYNKEECELHKKASNEFSYGISAQNISQSLKSIYGTEYYGNILNKTVEEDQTGYEESYGVNLVHLIPFLIGAINEQQKQINELKTKLGECNE